MRAVLFDFGGVLTEPMAPMFAAVAAAAGAEPAEVASLLVGSYHGDDHPLHRLERGEGTFEDLCRWGDEEGARRGWRGAVAASREDNAARRRAPVLDRPDIGAMLAR